ncbi:cytochrome P450 [Streptomyces sp. VRA16 Mangrove soil]|uniref:cytochrome P450 n=1 Tax=Streptomyces sp. VRA16 Mangrove soil TaxID=2817434 RepID=UPI001A9CF2E4|nr:cytochrome P450 [Streptomyces sp. VRA16 Mangrove soil]MBO1331719.1 cytochrome P450 [Streptomyces sp. VRA16 Mangrove soil]
MSGTASLSAPRRLPPVVDGSPLVGSLPEMLRDTLGAFRRARENHGDLVRFHIGPPGLRRTMYGAFSAEAAQLMLATRATDFRKDNAFYEEVRLGFGNGLLTSQDEAYLRQRRLVQPLFTRRGVDTYDRAVVDEARVTADSWKGERTVEAASAMEQLTLRIVARILFGADIDEAIPAVRRCFPLISDTSLKRGLGLNPIPRGWPTPGNRRYEEARTELYGVCDQLIARRRAAGDPGQDLLGLLIQARTEDGESLSDDEIRDQVLVFLLAGHETTATTLTFGLHLLGRNPQVQRRAHEELDAVLGDGRAPRAADMERLPYLERVVKEALRLYPAAAAVGRRAVVDTELDGMTVPAGSDIAIASYVIHRHPEYWDEPERFDPDRFLPEAEKARPRYAWLPFGGGPRACIGAHFAMLESVLALAVLLRRYEVTAEDRDVRVGYGITLYAAQDVTVEVRERG